MSRGFGRIQRRILAALRSDPEGAFTSDELCTLIYGRKRQTKHRSSVLRAMRGLAMIDPTVAPLESMRGVGAAIYLSGSRTGGQLARAKLALLKAHRHRIYSKPLDRGDRVWLIWDQLRREWLTIRPELLGEARQSVLDIQQRYCLTFDDACALLASYGWMQVAENRKRG